MEIVHVSLDIANDFVARLHRHHDPVQGHRFSIGAVHDGRLVGVASVGRPVAPAARKKAKNPDPTGGLDPRLIVEVTRNCTDGTPHACSALYGAAARAAQAQGFFAIITYTLLSEQGISLKASGWWPELASEYFSSLAPFAAAGRERSQEYLGRKMRWVRFLRDFPELIPSLNPKTQGSQQGLLAL